MARADFTGFYDLGTGLLNRLGSRLSDKVRSEIAEYLEYGEEGLAADILASMLIIDRVVITVEEQDMLARMFDYFPATGSEESRRTYGCIYNRDDTFARLNVVEPP